MVWKSFDPILALELQAVEVSRLHGSAQPDIWHALERKYYHFFPLNKNFLNLL